MNTDLQVLHTRYGSRQGTLASYVTGFIFSIVLTVIPYLMVSKHLFAGGILVVLIIALALAQLFVQLVFFLHLKSESKPRWNLTVFAFTALIVVFVVGGSLWIMHNLNHNMMIDSDMMNEMIHIENQAGGF